MLRGSQKRDSTSSAIALWSFRAILGCDVRPVPDPEVLLVTGTIDTEGNVSWGTLDQSRDGVVDDPEPGATSIRVLDAMDQVLAEVSFNLDFTVMIEPAGAIGMNVVPFAFSVPYPENAVQVQLVHNERILARQNLTSKLLHDAVASIPDNGFIRRPIESRQALLHKIDSLDQQLASGAILGARVRLETDIRSHLEAWLVNDYVTQSPLEYTKNELLELVDDLSARLTTF